MNTDDAMVWAEEFCRTFNGKHVVRVDTGFDSEDQVDPGLMVGWFANAMQAGINQYERRRLRVKDEIQNIFEGDKDGV
ncbi:MAG: hypothetical protein ABWY25_06295 [Paenisporosarcina sp.]